MVSRQGGTAAAFVPLLDRLRRQRPDLDVHVFCYPASAGHFDQAGHRFQEVGTFQDAAPQLDALGPIEFVLTGTSEIADDDAAWWRWAKTAKAGTIAFVDQWTCYRERFTPSPGGAPDFSFIDRVAVVDDIAAAGVVNAGCPRDRIVETGTPALDSLLMAPKSAGETIRRREIKDGGGAIVLFACEDAWRPDWQAKGFANIAAYDQALGLCVSAAGQCPDKISLLVKPHPRQIASGEVPARPVPEHPGLSIRICDQPREEILHAADIVLGVSTMMLYEAAALGKPVISVQPGKAGVCDLTDRHPGITVVETESALREALDRALGQAGPRRPREPAARADHSARFLKALGMSAEGLAA